MALTHHYTKIAHTHNHTRQTSIGTTLSRCYCEEKDVANLLNSLFLPLSHTHAHTRQL